MPNYLNLFKNMDLHCKLLVYLDQSSILSKMKTSSEEYIQELSRELIAKFHPMRYLLEIDIMDLLEISPDVGEWLIQEPIKFQKASSSILYACLQAVNEDNKAVVADQVAVDLRLKSVPRPLVPPNQSSYTGLISFNGILLSVTEPESYVYHAVWSCPEECVGNEVIFHNIPEVPPKCHVCKSKMFENSGSRQCGDRVRATFKLYKSLMPTSFMIHDDQIELLKPGSRYNIYASALKKSTIVICLEEIIPLSAPITAPAPAGIKDLYEACEEIPWRFIYCLASNIGLNVAQRHQFMHLKICLLLSLSSIKANMLTGSTLIHVLATGYDTGYVGSLMEEASKLAERSVFFGTTNTTPTNALVGSSGGVCVLPLSLHIYNQKQISEMLSYMEARQIPTETHSVNLQSAVWATGFEYKKNIMSNMAAVFGTVCRGDWNDCDDEKVEFLLQNAVEPYKASKEDVEMLKDVRGYIDLSAGIAVSLNPGTRDLLQKYFLAARQESASVLVGSMDALVAICLTSARLCRRDVASMEDAVFAIWLHVCGGPEPRYAPEEYLQTPKDDKSLKEMMDQFKNWLKHFTGVFFQ